MSTLTITTGQVGNIISGANPGAAGSGSSEPASLLPGPESSLEQSGDPSALLAVLTMKTAKMDREAHTAMRRSEEATQDKAETAQVSALRDEAHDARVGAWVSGLATIGSAAASAAGAGAAAGGARAIASGIAAEALKGAGQVSDGMSKADEILNDAKATEAEQLANHAKRAVGDERDAVKDAKDLMDKAIEFFKEYSSGKNQAMAAATHRA